MDCCNYVPYGQQHHAPYHHHAPPYHHQYAAGYEYYAPREYYAPPPPPPPAPYECYGGGRYACASPYYAPPPPQACPGGWPPPPPLDDPFRGEYVYNPKEARIRKAMREALRDRAIGAASALARPGARRPAPPWLGAPSPSPAPATHQPAPHDELIMPGSTAGIPPRLAASPAGGRYPLPPGDPYAPPPYGGRLDPPISVAPEPDYMNQPNPLAQLQQQTEMWTSYPDMSPRGKHPYLQAAHPSLLSPTSSPSLPGGGYMMHEAIPTPPHHYQPAPPHPHHHRQHHQSPLPGEMGGGAGALGPPPALPLSLPLTPPHSNENVPPEGEGPPYGAGEGPGGRGAEPSAPLAETGNHEPFGNVYVPDRALEGKIKKPRTPPAPAKRRGASPKPLPAFTAAFGSTERGGRFQRSPPEPPPPDGLYLDTPQVKFDDFPMGAV